MTLLHLRSQTNIRRVHTMCTRKHFLRIIRYDSTTFIFPRSSRTYNRPPYVHTTDRTNISSTYFRPSVWKYIKGGPLEGAYNSLIDTKAQTDIVLHKDFIDYIDKTKSVRTIDSKIMKNQQNEIRKK